MSGYIWYSFGSDKTGPALGKALGFDAGKKTPDFERYDVVLGWSCKPGKKYNAEGLAQLIAQGGVRVLNHPRAVDRNRNKLRSLSELSEKGIAVPGFMEFDPSRPKVLVETLVPDALDKGRLQFPLVLLNSYNRGEPVFCYSLEDVAAGVKGNKDKEHPFDYLRTLDQGEEYRVHVFRDAALCAQKKIQAGDPRTQMVDTLMKRLKSQKKKEGTGLSQAQEVAAGEMALMVAGELLANSAQLKKSVQFGWKYADWNLKQVPAEVSALAIDALDAAELDLGAVSISFSHDKQARVLSITTAPALSEEQMGLYVSEIKAFSGDKSTPKEKKAKRQPKEKKASAELVARLYRKVRGLSADKAEEVLQSLEE